MFQHPEASVEIEKTAISNIEGKGIKLELPENYTVLPPTKSTSPEFPLQSVNYTETEDIKASNERSKWLNAVDGLNKEEIEDNIKVRMSWPAFHSNEVSNVPVKSLSTLLPLLRESINSTAMMRHSIDIVKQILLKINPSQCPVITADQPVLYPW
eukprot:Seg5293.3 transcript_id=Seg5293.3/GoldUCD/mRNA.D3Y31 product="hypothetical protein" protein_id=Seg5293.3/GoldUCD/D3Y31